MNGPTVTPWLAGWVVGTIVKLFDSGYAGLAWLAACRFSAATWSESFPFLGVQWEHVPNFHHVRSFVGVPALLARWGV